MIASPAVAGRLDSTAGALGRSGGRTRTTTEAHFELEVVRAGEVVVLRGRLDVRVTADVRLALTAALADGSGALVVDTAGLDGVDATGLGVLVGAHRAAGRVGRTLVLHDVPLVLARVLLLTRLDRVLHITRSAVSA